MPTVGQRMSSPGPTEQQRRALEARGTSIAVSAGAGCGKTFVLTERFLAELQPDAPQSRGRRSRLSQVVAITFTERAAREMRERIRSACNRRLRKCPDAETEYWLELVRDLDSARVSTIHSFCASLLRAHAVEARLDPRFSVLDGVQAGALLFTLTDDVLRDRLAERQEAAISLVARFGLDRLRAMIAQLLAVRQEIDWEQWRGETAESLAARWERFFREDALPRMIARLADFPAAKTVLEIALQGPSDHPAMRERFAALTEILSKIKNACDSAPGEPLAGVFASEAAGGGFTDILSALREAARVQGGGTKKNWSNVDEYERFKDAASDLRKEIDRVEQRASFDPAAARPAAELSLMVINLAAEIAEQYERSKREMAVLDFNDLLIHARRLLVGAEQDALRKRLAAQIRLLLVDEFQDTDPLQVELVKAICDNEHLCGKLFLVGDYKQSIYRFRGADPRVFGRLRGEISPKGRLPLSLNFRSQPAVLEFVNALFVDELGPEYEPLVAARPQIGPAPAVEFLWASEQTAPDEDRQDADGGRALNADAAGQSMAGLSDDMGPRERARRREAEWIARRIRAMLESGEKIVWDTESAAPSARPPRPGDFALLFRAMTNVEYYEDALQRYGIDYYLVGGRAFYAQQEIYDLLNLLRALDSLCDEVSLVGALRSPLFGLHDETLFWLARNGGGLAAGLFADPPEQLDDLQREQTRYAAETIRRLRSMKDRLPVALLIQEALELTGYDALLLAEFLGERKLANLHKLIEQGRSFDRAGTFTLSDFITQLAEFVVRQPDEPLAATCPESTDVVKLMSIHQSKGLEFPVVIVPDLDRPRRWQGPPVAFTPSLGPMFKDPDATTGYDLFMAAENDEDAAESKRLLYVAATRAADYLILSSGIERRGAAGPWMELLDKRFDIMTGRPRTASAQVAPTQQADSPSPGSAPESSPTGVAAAIKPLAVVTTEPPEIESKPANLRARRDLLKIVEKAEQMAAEGAGRQPRCLTLPEIARPALRQFSFSRLSGELLAGKGAVLPGQSEESDLPEPLLDPCGLGTLVHAVLEQVDFARPDGVQELVSRLAPEHFPGEGVDLGEPIEMIERFLRSPRAAELATAKELYRELEFMLAWPPGKDGDGMYLRGFIDCLYRGGDGRLRLLDFKTNRADGETLASVAAGYEMQMRLYALAAESIIHESPAELSLCFLRPGLEYEFRWDEESRREVKKLVDDKLFAHRSIAN